MRDRLKPRDVDAYIAGFPPKVRSVRRKVRRTVRDAAPGATEKIGYGIPAFTLRRIVVYYAAFKGHIGIYPPVRGDAKLERDLARYRNPRGNLSFPLDEPTPYDLIRRIAEARVAEISVKAAPRPGRSSGFAPRQKCCRNRTYAVAGGATSGAASSVAGSPPPPVRPPRG